MKKKDFKEELSFRSLYKLILHFRKFFIIFISSTLIVIFAYSFIMPHSFEAMATALPPDENEGKSSLSSFLSNLSVGISAGGVSQGYKLLLISDIMKSRESASYIVKKTKFDSLPEYQFPNRVIMLDFVLNCIDVKINRTGLIVISSIVPTRSFPNEKSKNLAAKLSADFCNYAVEALDSINKNKNISKAKRKRIFIEKVLVEKNSKLDSIDRAIETFQKSNKIVAIDDQTKAILENAVSIGTELSSAEVDLGLMMLDYNQGSPKVAALQKKISELQNQYHKAQSGGIIPTDKFSIPLSDVPTLIRVYANLVREQKILLQVTMYLETQKYQEAIQEEGDFISAEILDRAIQPFDKSSPNLKIMLLLAFIISSILGFTGVLFYSYRKGLIYTISDEASK